ncbi:pseudouridine synthase [Paludibacterium yongneupense]|uniref:pseudouridine synthase n=1 Tax=Paludibacterium yongneupense TaxID=400061 RepID=UPI0003F84ACF|nr:pseudouridine synthase [Paludibacterium yongneupense]
MELYRFLQQQGFGSRKECRQLVEYGLVEIDGHLAQDYRLPVDVAMISALLVDGEPWQPVALPLYLMLNKPAGYETSHKPQHHRSVYSLLPRQFSRLEIAAVGRLDVDTTGLLLLTTDGACVHALSSPRRHVAKRYEVTLKHPADAELIRQLKDGVLLKDEKERVMADEAEILSDERIALTISQGKYHQVKRMVAAAGNRVVGLHRTALGRLELGELEEGCWRLLTADELERLGLRGE